MAFRKALQMILRKAMESYDDQIEDGSFGSLPKTYRVPADPAERIVVQTSRMMDQQKLVAARLHFDPLGFESARAFGRRLAMAALAAFFAGENRGS